MDVFIVGHGNGFFNGFIEILCSCIHLLVLTDLVVTREKNLHEIVLMQEIARTQSSTCKNLHQLASYNETSRASCPLKWSGKQSCSRKSREQDVLPNKTETDAEKYVKSGEMCEK